MEGLLEYVVRALVHEPDAVEIAFGERRGEQTLRIRVAEEDRGAVIGRQGRTIKAIETVLQATSAGNAPTLEVDD